MTAPVASTSSPEHNGPATVTGTGAPGRRAEQPHPVLRPDEGRPQHVVDAAIEDHDRRAVDGLRVDDGGEVGARGTDEEATGLQQQAGVGEHGIGRPAVDDARPARGRGRRGPATPRAARTGCQARRRRPRSGRSCRSTVASSRAARAVVATWATSALASSTFEAPNAWSPRSSRCCRSSGEPRRIDQVRRVHPELAGAVVADQPHALEPGHLGDGGAKHDRLAPAGGARDPLEPRRARRATRRSPRGCRPRRAASSSLVALARSGHDDPLRRVSRRAGPWPARRPTRRPRRVPGRPGAPRSPAPGWP